MRDVDGTMEQMVERWTMHLQLILSHSTDHMKLKRGTTVSNQVLMLLFNRCNKDEEYIFLSSI